VEVETSVEAVEADTIAEPVVEEAAEDETSVEAVEVETVAEPVVEEAVEVETSVEAVEADTIAEPVVEEAAEVEIIAETVEVETIKDAIESEGIASTIVEESEEKEEKAIANVQKATDNKVEAVVGYSEAIKDEEDAAEIVTETAIIQTGAEEAIVEASEKISELVESEASEVEIKEALSDLEGTIESKNEAEGKLSEAVMNEEQASLTLGKKAEEKNEAEEKLNNEIKELEAASKKLDAAIAQQNKSEIELAQATNVDEKVIEGNSKPFAKGDYVSHGVYGNGDVLSSTKAGKHWSIEVNFSEGKRRILGTFLTKLDKTDTKTEENKYVPPIETIEEEKIKTYDEHSGKYKPGTEVLHDIFGKGFVRESEPKGDNHKLIINFEDGSERTLLSTFIKLPNEDKNVEAETVIETVVDEPVLESEEAEPVAEAIVAEPVTEYEEAEPVAETIVAEPVLEPVEAEPVAETIVAEPVLEPVEAEPVAETIVAEPVLEPLEAGTVVNSNDMFKRPAKKVEDVIDLSKPEIQDAEMVDYED
ncbi:MAG: hypothetical protein VXX45_01650, partial [Candidatus Thermoplasmatota archaeon]|nr:hypothetical protein [Candidatus Thermoplasmatota archaeon]